MILNKSMCSAWLFVVVILVESLISVELSFLISLFFVAFLINHNLFLELIKKIKNWWPFMLISLLAVTYGLFSNEFKLVVKDLWYFTKPLLYFSLGVLLSKKVADNFFNKTIIFISLLTALIYVSPILFTGDWLNLTADEMRDKHGQGSYIFVFGICLLWKNKKYLNRYLFRYGIAFLLLVIILSSSRIMLLFLVVFLVVIFFSKYLAQNLLQLSLVILMVFFVIPKSTYEINDLPRGSFFEKIVFSFGEIRPQTYLLDQDIHNYWRGYEANMIIKQYIGGDLYQILLGQGLGKHVDIDFPKRERTGEGIVYRLEWLHNGYLAVILKTGLIGLISFLLLIKSLFNSANSLARENGIIARFLVLTIFISTYFLGGYFNKEDVLITFCILGYVLGAKSRGNSSIRLNCGKRI